MITLRTIIFCGVTSASVIMATRSGSGFFVRGMERVLGTMIVNRKTTNKHRKNDNTQSVVTLAATYDAAADDFDIPRECSGVAACAGLDGDCCPATDGVFLSCCLEELSKCPVKLHQAKIELEDAYAGIEDYQNRLKVAEAKIKDDKATIIEQRNSLVQVNNELKYFENCINNTYCESCNVKYMYPNPCIPPASKNDNAVHRKLAYDTKEQERVLGTMIVNRKTHKHRKNDNTQSVVTIAATYDAAADDDDGMPTECSANGACAGLDGPCCPNAEGKFLICCLEECSFLLHQIKKYLDDAYAELSDYQARFDVAEAQIKDDKAAIYELSIDEEETTNIVQFYRKCVDANPCPVDYCFGKICPLKCSTDYKNYPSERCW